MADSDFRPSFFAAGENHNIASGNENWFQSALNSITNIPKYTTLALGSGITGILNTGVSVANLFASKNNEFEAINYGRAVMDFDDNLGKYYQENQQGIDTWGFIGTSLVPGTLGVKVFNRGQKVMSAAAEAGQFGWGMSKATGILVPRAEKFMTQAATELATGSNAFRFMNANVMKAIGAKAQQNLLEAAAFETAVLATSFKSPFLEDMDAFDIAVNFATGVVLGGAVGTAFSIPGVKRGIVNQVNTVDQAFIKSINRAPTVESMPESIKATTELLNKRTLAKHLDNLSDPEYLKTLDAEVLPGVTKATADAKQQLTNIDNAVRTSVRKMSKNDDIGNKFADDIIGMNPDASIRAIAGADDLLRIADTVHPTPVAVLRKMLGKDVDDRITVWTGTQGADRGKLFTEVPAVRSLADDIRISNPKISLQTAIDDAVKSAGFGKTGPLYNVMKMDMQTIQKRRIWGLRSMPSPGRDKIISLHMNDVPGLEAIRNGIRNIDPNKIAGIRLVDDAGKVIDEMPVTGQLIDDALLTQKSRLIGELQGKDIQYTAEVLNVNPGLLDGTNVLSGTWDNFMYQHSLSPDGSAFYKPRFIGSRFKNGGMNGFDSDAETMVAAYLKEAQESVDRTIKSVLSDVADISVADAGAGTLARLSIDEALPNALELANNIKYATRAGSGARLISFANGSYGSLESAMQYIGSLTTKLRNTLTNRYQEQLASAANGIRHNPAAATEVSVVNEILNMNPNAYVMGEGKLIHKSLASWDGKGAIPELPQGVRGEITFSHPEAFEFIKSHHQVNSRYVSARNELKAAQGKDSNWDPETVYGIKPNPRTYKYFAFVIDPTVMGAGRTTMVHARDSATLAKMIDKVNADFPSYRVVTKSDSQDYHKALGDYEADRAMNSINIDSELRAKGINSQFLPQTDGDRIAANFNDFHANNANNLTRHIISAKYEAPFKELLEMGRVYSRLESSSYASGVELALESSKNPYMEYMKTALAISNKSDYAWLNTMNEFVDQAASKAWNLASDLLRKSKSSADLDSINKVFEDHGFRTAYYDAATDALANHAADKNILSRFVRAGNTALATTLLRWDFINAINNKLGSLILTSTETRHVIDQIRKGGTAEVGRLAEIAETAVPGTTDNILAPQKLMINAIRNWVQEVSNKESQVIARYKKMGWVPEDLGEIQKLIDSASINGVESSVAMSKKIEDLYASAKKIAATGERITGNKYVETLNRFMSANIMDQLTDVLVRSGKMSVPEANTYINTFVNRTQVNITPSQRPLLFQGPIGMAIGLFQSYQANLMQQMFRYAAPGNRKALSMLGGMQTSFYGLNGLPGFQQFNEHIIATASGNDVHKDLYTQIYGDVPTKAADFILYGMPSNILGINLFVRGDLTPQHPTIIPLSPTEVPVAAKLGSFFGNLKQTVSDIAEGAPAWDTFLRGLEHNSISRPLTGIAQTIRAATVTDGNVISTTRQGNFIYSNDLFSLATLGRLAGGRPFDEAKATDNYFRTAAYQALDRENQKKLGEFMTRANAQGYNNFDSYSLLEQYVANGGKQANFAKFAMTQYSKATENQSMSMEQALKNPYAQRLQMIMGGSDASFGLY